MPDKSITNRVSRRTAILAGFCLLVTCVILTVNFVGPVQLAAPLSDAENYLQDFFARTGRLTAANTNLVLLGIDQPSYGDLFSADEAKSDPVVAALQENWPLWSRKVSASLITRLAEAGAKSIAVDLVFANELDGDEELRVALDKYKDRVVIGSDLNLAQTDRGEPAGLLVPDTKLIPDTSAHPAALDPRVGFVNIWLDDDVVFRRTLYRASNHVLGDIVNTGPDTIVSSFDARVVGEIGRKNLPPPNTRQFIRFTGPPGTWPGISIGEVFDPKAWKLSFNNGKFFRDKIVLVGPTANIFQDLHNTPFRGGEMPGPEIHLNIINAALNNEFLRTTSPLASGAIIALSGLLAAILCQFVRAPVRRLFVIFAVGAAYFFAAKLSYDHVNLIVPVVNPLLALMIIGVGALAYDFVAERLERMKLRHTMGLYFSPRVLDAVLSDPGSMRPRRADVTLLLTDLRNSTPLAEALGPQGMFDLLNRVFEAQTSAIMSEDGNLEHFLGDQFLSYWGAPQKQPDAGDRAERAAMKLIRALESLRATLSPEVQRLFGYGVALHSGSVLIGNKGSALRLDYGLVGDTVNEAARVEALTKYYGVKLLVTRDTYAQFSTQGTRRLLDRVVVKGKSEPVELFECENPCTPENYGKLCSAYKAAYDQYFFGKFAEAGEQFGKLWQEYADGPSKALAARCGELAASPPQAWDGVWKMDAK